ncbi:MAG: serine/threonine-protein kinase, partial [Myxococcota bacterium]
MEHRDHEELAGYRIVRRLGEGGMGVVYLAEKTKPFVRRVALKVMRAQALTETARIRFQLEQEMLARLSHPNIAQIYEAGSAEDGSPFFAMELVEGRRIAKYCAQEELNVKERLGLFLQVCSAVQFAHQRGILHRDLKPSNILVQEDRREPVVKLIDFGIAKALDRLQDGPDERSYLGTPAYMAPESFEPELGLDTRSDVYSLGLVFQEILTDTNPLGGTALNAPGASEEALLLSGEVDADAATVVLEHAASSEAERSTRLRGDLGAIVKKAISSKRDERYDSVTGLSDDIRRYLDGFPVLARPRGALYRLGKLINRHRVAFAAAALVVVAIAVGTLSTIFEAQRANRESRTSAELARFMVELFEVADPSASRGKTITAKEVLDQGAQRIEEDLDAPAGLRARLAMTIGVVYRSLGLYDESRELLSLAVSVLETSAPDSEELAQAWVEFG